jgi:hypothetical protein
VPLSFQILEMLSEHSLSQSLYPMIIFVAELCIFVAMHEFPGRLVQIYFYQYPFSRVLDRCWLSRPFHSVPSACKCGMAGTHTTQCLGMVPRPESPLNARGAKPLI